MTDGRLRDPPGRRTRSSRSCWATPSSRSTSPRRLLDHGIYVIGFSYPVVPKGQARIRVQLSAAHTDEDIDRAIAAFVEVKGRLLPG